MSAPSSNSVANRVGARPRPAFARLLSRAARLAVMAVIMAVGFLLLQTFRELLHDAPTAQKEKIPAKAVEAAPQPGAGFRVEMLSHAFFQPGAWSLGESDWSVVATELSGPAVEARMQFLGKPSRGEARPSALEEKVLIWLRQLRPKVVNNCLVYNAPINSMQVRAVTEKRGGRERLRLAQMLWKQGSSIRLLEAMPAPMSVAAERGGSHLMPLPKGVPSLARRWDNGEHLACEIIGPAQLEECLRAWSAAGWTTEKIAGEELFSLVLLRNGQRTIQLCLLEAERPGLPAYLLLTARTAEP